MYHQLDQIEEIFTQVTFFFQLYARLIYITHVIHYYMTVFILGCYDCHHPLYFRLTNQDDSCTMVG